MKFAKIILLFFAFIFCNNSHSQSSNHRPRFEKKKIMVQDKKIMVEIADTDEKRAYGLMFVKKLPLDEGMLFVFDEAEIQSFWMKNTLIPLSIGYFDGQGILIESLEMEPESLLARQFKAYPSRSQAKYALEMNKGWFKKNGIKPGAHLKILP